MPPHTNPPMSPPLPMSPTVQSDFRPHKKWPWIIGGLIVFCVVTFVLMNLFFPGTPAVAPDTQLDLASSTPVSVSTPVLGKAPFLISANVPPPKGFDYFQTEDLLIKNGATLFVFAQHWDIVEPSAGTYTLQDGITNPFTVLVPKYPFKGVVLVFKMIDSNVRTMPSDLKDKPFDDPMVVARFLKILHMIAGSPGVAGHVQYILLGNEVDGYFVMHPNELPGFMTLLKKSIDQLHQDLPGVQVGTITTFNSLKKPNLFRTLTQYSDIIDYTYYPLGDNWQMRPVSDAAGDIATMAQAAGNKWFGFTEIGYSSSAGSSSSESQQADFLKSVFQNLEKVRNQVAFVNWAGISDSPLDVCQTYARSQGLPPSDSFCSYAAYGGLRTYENQPRPAWGLFVQEMQKVKGW